MRFVRLLNTTAAYFYYVRFTEDRLIIKTIVGASTFISVVDTVATMVWSYEWIVKLWGSVPGSGNVPVFVLPLQSVGS